MRRCVSISALLVFCCFSSVQAQTLLHTLHPQPRQAYQRFFSAVFVPTPGHIIFLDPQKPAWDEAARINAFLREKGHDTLEARIWTDIDTLQSGIFLGVCADLINGMLASYPDQPIKATSVYPGPEGYVFDAMPMRVLINGCDPSGLRYGVQTLLQLLFPTPDWWGLEPCRIIDAPEFPVRWMYHSTNIQVGGNVTEAKALWDEALKHRLNGVQLNDSKFARPTTLPQRYLDSLAALRDYAADRGLSIIPGVMPFGYSNDLLFHNPNLASGLPVRDQRFVFEADTARLVRDVPVQLPNGGFEQYNGDQFSGFRFIDQPGLVSFADTQIKHSGNASIRFENFAQQSPQYGHGRISYWTRVKPFTLYHVRGWVRTESLTPASSITISVLSNAGYSLAFNEFSIPSTTDWRAVDFTFNSLEADTVGIYWGTWGAKTGRIWWDDLLFEEAGFVNLIRREGAPLSLSRSVEGPTLTEGVDFDTLRDVRMGNRSYPGDYDKWHTAPTLRRRTGGSLSNGDTFIASYYHAILIYSDQVAATMSDPEVYDVLNREFAMLDSIVHTGRYFMNHDEIRTMNWDAGDEQRGLRPAEILADNVDQCLNIIDRHSPEADVWVWSDMFDEFHNAVEGPYYLVHGDLRGSADMLPKRLGIVNWNGRANVVQQSLNYFANLGFRQISAPFYDQDEQQILKWKEWTRDVPNFHGMMYTTWSRNYNYLEAFGDYAWNHAPYIYHYPPSVLRAGEDLYFSLRVEGDRWDPDWQLQNMSIQYRTHPGDAFTLHPVQLQPGVDDMLPVLMPPDAKWLQWYVTATDNRGWTTRVPLGDTVFYELGSIATALEQPPAPTDLFISAAPNPARSGSRVRVSWSAPVHSGASLLMYDILGRVRANLDLGMANGHLESTMFDLQALSPGLYMLELLTRSASIRTTTIVVGE